MARTERVNAVVTSKTKKALEKLSSTTGISQSEIINIAIQEHLKVKSAKEDINFITKEIDRAIDSKLDSYHNRLFRLLAKMTKAIFTSLYINGHMLSYMCNSNISQEFLKKEIEIANKKAYQVLRSGFLEEDVTQLFPSNLKDFDEDNE
ncbi:MAG: hypothetical protein HFJ53_03345 [Clostridia bacterium]|jgi:DNA topoisomerase IA|nr:hypothetical protein [Clostridia bacterium]